MRARRRVVHGDCASPAPSAVESDSKARIAESSGIYAAVTAHVHPAAGVVGVGWREWSGASGSGCGLYAFVAAGPASQWYDVSCVAGAPPNPGWGRLLP